MDVRSNLNEIQKKINQALKESLYENEPEIIAVTKYVSNERAEEARSCGIIHFGENRIEGFLEKKKFLKDVKMHFIGTLQTRKVKDVINEVDFLHSLDRISLAKEIEKRANHMIDCFIQVNVSDEASKHGLHPDELPQFLLEVSQMSKINVVGLMTMAPAEASHDEIRHYFRKLKNLQLEVAQMQLTHVPCQWLSMGMSNDYEIAISEGADFVRIGTKLVG